MKLLLTLSIGLLYAGQLLAQSESDNSVPFDQLVKTEVELRNGGFINLYHYKGELYTGSAIEKKFAAYILYRFKDGKEHGNRTHYTKTNRRTEEWEYENGMLKASREWYLDGDLKQEVEFTRKGRFKKKTEWRRSGELKETVQSRKFSKAQKVKRYSLTGDLSEKGDQLSVERGKKVETVKIGKWVYYDRKGKRKKTEKYDDLGQLISSKKH